MALENFHIKRALYICGVKQAFAKISRRKTKNVNLRVTRYDLEWTLYRKIRVQGCEKRGMHIVRMIDVVGRCLVLRYF